MEMYRSKPISHYFRAVYFDPKYHCMVWQQCTGPNPFHAISGLYIFIQLHHCILWKCSGPNPFHGISGLYIFIQSTVRTHCLWTQFCNYLTIQEAQFGIWHLWTVSYFVPSLTFCQSIWILGKSADINLLILNWFGESLYIYMTPQTREVLFWWF
jgi:hypothetical protein